MYYLSFDCATKTFAFCFGWVDLSAARMQLTQLRSRIAQAQVLFCRADELMQHNPAAAQLILANVTSSVAQLDAETRAFVRIIDGCTVDLCPGVADADICTVRRIKLVVSYITSRIMPLVVATTTPATLTVLIEYQMGQNSPARTVAVAIGAALAQYHTIIVGPSLKNQIHLCFAGQYQHFAKKYQSTYTANKAHTRYNFAHAERVFASSVPTLHPHALRGHVADSFMQILGWVVRGGREDCF
jgi:hypothetical protein